MGFYVATSTALAFALPLAIPVFALTSVGAFKAGPEAQRRDPPASGQAVRLPSDAVSPSAAPSSVGAALPGSPADRQRVQAEEAVLPAWFGIGYSTVNKTIWLLHDWAWAPVLGKGR